MTENRSDPLDAAALCPARAMQMVHARRRRRSDHPNLGFTPPQVPRSWSRQEIASCSYSETAWPDSLMARNSFWSAPRRTYA
jgi:hypothetical protein